MGTSLHKNVLLKRDMYCCQCCVYLWIQIMKMPLWKVEEIASGTHYGDAGDVGVYVRKKESTSPSSIS